ncbi:MAG: hypothetical protein KatS3mg108_2043 [Isosphaeraceae bacterium]|jgi:O-antigen/teichoic acid export membrane protein|nr:MAG: hypothetical protein KatS3mg108_2043 [Isosphaeraceae bacterium]
MFRVIARNIIANWLGYAVNAVVGLLLTPFVLQHLGQSRYGIYSLVASLIGYYGLLDLGLRAGTTQLLTRQLAAGNHDALNRTFSSVLVALAGLAVTMGLLSLLLGWFGPELFRLPAELRPEFFGCVVLVGATAAVQCLLFPFSSLFTATQRYDLSNSIGITFRLLLALAIWWVLSRGHGLLGLAAVSLVVNGIEYSARALIAYRLVPQLRIQLSGLRLADLRPLFGFSFWNFLIAINTIILYQTDSILIGLFLPVAAIALYALASNLIRYLADVLGSARSVFFPAAAHLFAANDRPALERLYILGSRFVLMAVAAVVIMAGCWAGDFFRVWVGRRSLDAASLATAVLVFRILLIHLAAEFAAGASGQILLGSGRIKILGVLAFGQAVLNLAVSIALAPWLGLVGVALGTVVSSITFRAVPTVLLASRLLGISSTAYLRWIVPRPFAFAALLALSCLTLRRLDPPDSFAHLALHGLLAALLSAGLGLALGLEPAARARLLGRLPRLGLRSQPRPIDDQTEPAPTRADVC